MRSCSHTKFLAGVQHGGWKDTGSGMLFDKDIDEQLLVKHLKSLS